MNVTDSVHDILSGRQPISLSLHVAGGIAVAIIILTCCCTLLVRHKCARIADKITGRRKKEKYPPDIEEGRGRKRVKKWRKKKRRTISPELVQDQVEVTAPIISREAERSENGSPTPCYKCFRKKKKRRSKRQIR
ncbi:uncharacterized protein LOC114939406 [Nylanderia fulva]|uniref:uncharacterized protein LOC114939406 n=1 Tax=Nylanderia fulva TaxID=613905 RepID=UPI0010FAF973|nr:uncharacterized protein LOC114939406 [Nylanderia fulva]